MGASPVPWTTVSRTTLVADRWIRLHADECLDEHARRIAPYYVLEYSDWVSVLAVDRDGAAIVVEEYRHGAGVLALGTVGGGAGTGRWTDSGDDVSPAPHATGMRRSVRSSSGDTPGSET